MRWFAELREKGFTGRKGLADPSLKTVASYTKAFLRWLNDVETPPSLRGMSIGKARTGIRLKGELAAGIVQEELDRLAKWPFLLRGLGVLTEPHRYREMFLFLEDPELRGALRD